MYHPPALPNLFDHIAEHPFAVLAAGYQETAVASAAFPRFMEMVMVRLLGAVSAVAVEV